jgi:ribosomal protein S18 acetylase RimI-like enzyme
MTALEAQPPPFRLRPALPEDGDFLFRLFAENQPQLEPLRAQEAVWRQLVDIQYRGRAMTYSARFPHSMDSILLDSSDMPIGRLLVDHGTGRDPLRWMLVDIALLAAHCGRGVGTAVLRQLLQQAAEAGAAVELQVTPFNRARRLYERLGFQLVGQDMMGADMVWRPAGF